MSIDKAIPGYSVHLEIRENTSDSDVVKEMFDENTYNIHDGDFEECRTFVDIGANIGCASILAMTKGAKYIYAYEPEYHNYNLLEKNLTVNQLNNAHIVTYNDAVSDKVKKLYIDNNQGGSQTHETGRGQSVLTTTLNKALRDIRDVAVLKIDTEGGEYDIIAGATPQTLKKCRRIVMEYHQTEPEIFGAMVAKLSPYFHLTIFGDYLTGGGQIDAKRY